MKIAIDAMQTIALAVVFLSVCMVATTAICMLGSAAGYHMGLGTALASGLALFAGATMAAVSQ